MTAPYRLAGGGRIDRSRPLRFYFSGRRMEGLHGDTLASALLANGVHLAARSFKYHRPRGLMAAGAAEPNVLVDVEYKGARLPNLRATEVELVEGLRAWPVNAWPGLRFDFAAVNDVLAPVFSAGFQYKTFMLPGWRFWEPAIRRLAGLGRLSVSRDTPPSAHIHTQCDVLVAGAGPAGLAAARAASAAGASVLLVEQDTECGGSALWRGVEIDGRPASSWAASVEAEIRARPDVRILTRTAATGYYDHNSLLLFENAGGHYRIWLVRAQRVVLATGATERPLLFPGNDRPGIMLASAAQEYTRRFSVRLGGSVVVATSNDSAYEAARALDNVTAIADTRPSVDPGEKSFWRERGVPVYERARIVSTKGRHGIRQVRIGRESEPDVHLACDLLAVSGGWNPSVQLFSQSGGRLKFDGQVAAFVPSASVQREQSVGAAAGTFRLNRALEEGHAAGLAAAAAGGFTGAAPPPSTCAVEREYAVDPDWFAWEGRPQKIFVDFQNDVTASDIRQALSENMGAVEHLKRYTALGMGADQGRTSNVAAIALLAAAGNRSPEDVGTTAFRPPATPVPIAAFAGLRRDELFVLQRRSPLHATHVAHGALFEELGEWLRPAVYPLRGETRDAAVQREALCARNGAVLFDNSPLGKIEVAGPDAERFLDFVYANAMSNLQSGCARYGVMLNEAGILIDDGIAVRDGPDRFWLTTTSGGAGRIAAWLEEWLQCEFSHWDVLVAPVTETWAVPTLAGPRAREILGQLEPDFDISRTAFPHMTCRSGTLGGVKARVLRASYTGELSCEIYVAPDDAAQVWQRCVEAGATPVGTGCLLLLRTEKGYLHLGTDTDGTTVPADVGLGHVVRREGDFAGKRSLLLPALGTENRLQLVGLAPCGDGRVPAPGDRVRGPAGDEGHVTSSVYSPNLGRAVAMGMVRRGFSRMGEELALSSGGRVRIAPRAAWDQEGERLHA